MNVSGEEGTALISKCEADSKLTPSAQGIRESGSSHARLTNRPMWSLVLSHKPNNGYTYNSVAVLGDAMVQGKGNSRITEYGGGCVL